MKKAGIRGYGTCAWSYNASFDCKRPVTRSTSIERETNLSSREFLRGGGGGTADGSTSPMLRKTDK